MSPPRIDFLYDIGSPYSYLAATRIAGLESRTGARVHWHPFLLGAVMKATGNRMPSLVQAKARWLVTDLKTWAEQLGEPFQMSSHFPLNTLLTQRALVAAEGLFGTSALRNLSLALFRSCWVENQEVSKPEVICEVASSIGLDTDALTSMAVAQETKDKLRATTDKAIRRGAFGAPTFFLSNTTAERMFWGNDRLELLERSLEQP